MHNNIFKYKGAVHIHTKLSDGTGDISAITKAAKQAGLDWIIVTDHNYYDTEEGIINDIYVIKGQEISPKNCNHYLVFGLNDIIYPEESPNIYVNKVRELGGFGFAAHPDEGYTYDRNGNTYPRKNSNHCIPWTDKNIEPDGVEIWNWFSNWADNLNDKNIFSLAYAYIFKHNIITPPSKLTLNWWDKLNNIHDEIIPALGGVDAHALKIYKYIIPVTVFPYKTCFKTIINNINLREKLSEDFVTAKKQILTAIKNGNNIITNSHILNEVPKIYVTNTKNTSFCGESIDYDSECYLHFETDKNFETCLIYNGNVQKIFNYGKFIYHITNSGKYRLESRYKGRGYLYTNPFLVKSQV